MKCGTFEGDDDDESNMRIAEIKNRCKDKRISYTDESFAVVHCTGYIRVRIVCYIWNKKCFSFDIMF